MRRKTRVPVLVHLGRSDDSDRQRLQMVVQRRHQFERIPRLLQIAMTDLRAGMYAGICPSSRRNRVRARFQFGQSILDRPLNRGLIRLTLPTRKGATIIFYL